MNYKLNYVFKTRGIANFGTRCSYVGIMCIMSYVVFVSV